MLLQILCGFSLSPSPWCEENVPPWWQVLPHWFFVPRCPLQHPGTTFWQPVKVRVLSWPHVSCKRKGHICCQINLSFYQVTIAPCQLCGNNKLSLDFVKWAFCSILLSLPVKYLGFLHWQMIDRFWPHRLVLSCGCGMLHLWYTAKDGSRWKCDL